MISDRKTCITLTSSTLQETWTSSTSEKSPIPTAKPTAPEAGSSGNLAKSSIPTAKSTQEVGTTGTCSTVPAQSISREETVNSDIVNKPNNDGEVDIVTAQQILNSEEVRKLERDLYSGFKEAAEANAGRTSGFNQLRVEEIVPRENTVRDVINPINEAELDSNKQPDKSKDTKMPDIPEVLVDKPLMYPENKVNMFEDKYDIIKRRRDAGERAKQAELAKKAELSETPSTR